MLGPLLGLCVIFGCICLFRGFCGDYCFGEVKVEESGLPENFADYPSGDSDNIIRFRPRKKEDSPQEI